MSYTKVINTKPALYAIWYPILRDIAIAHGYELALHGSLASDMDIILVPWDEKPKPEAEMISAMCKKMGAKIVYDSGARKRPHGRKAYALSISANVYLDIIVMPTLMVND